MVADLLASEEPLVLLDAIQHTPTHLRLQPLTCDSCFAGSPYCDFCMGWAARPTKAAAKRHFPVENTVGRLKIRPTQSPNGKGGRGTHKK